MICVEPDALYHIASRSRELEETSRVPDVDGEPDYAVLGKSDGFTFVQYSEIHCHPVVAFAFLGWRTGRGADDAEFRRVTGRVTSTGQASHFRTQFCTEFPG